MDENTFNLIQRIAKEHSRRVFGYLDEDDLKNEIWLICMDKLADYTEERGSLEHFLRVSVHNRLVNRFKDITKSVRSPCPRCPFYDPEESPSDCAKFGDSRHLCKKWNNYQLSVESRNSLLNASEQTEERKGKDNILSSLEAKELKAQVTGKIDKDYEHDLELLTSGGKLSKQKLKKLKKEITRVLAFKPTPLTIRGKNAISKKG
jgi:DNA-directed RNA polymerase specialized sigma24 family protein